VSTRIEARLAQALRWPVDHPVIPGLMVLLLIVFSVSQVPGAQFDFSIEQLYPKDSALAQFHRAHLDRFGRNDDLMVVAREGDPFHADLRALEHRVQAIPGVLDTISPHSFERVVAADGGVTTRPLAPGERHPLVQGVFVADDDSAGALLVRIAQTHNYHTARDALLGRVEAALDELGGTWHLGGMPVVRTHYIRGLMSDARLMVCLSIGVAAFFFVGSFRDPRHVLMAVATISLCGAVAVAGYVASGNDFTLFGPAFIAVIVVVGTSDIIHLVHRFAEHSETAAGPKEAARRAASEVGIACLLTSATTALGFLALLATEIPPLRLFGVATGMGVIATYIITFLAVPPVLARIGAPSSRARVHAVQGAARMERLGVWVLDRHRGVLLVSAVCAALLVLCASQINADHRILEDIRADPTIDADQDFMEQHLGGSLPLQIELRFPGGDPRDPAAQRAESELVQWLRDQPIVGHAVGLSDLTRLTWGALGGEGEFPDTRAGVTQSLMMAGMGGRDPVPRFLWAEEGDVRSRITARLLDQGHVATLALVEATRKRAATLLEPAGGEAVVTGVAFLAQRVNATITRQFAGSFGIALVLIAGMWLLGTRSVRRTTTAVIPNVLPLLAMLGALGLLGITLKPSTAMVLSIALGIAVDDTIHFLSAYERARATASDTRAAILVAYRTAGRSMVDTTLVLVSGFALMRVSSFPATGTFGILTAWTIFMALVTDLVVLGPMILVLDRREMPGDKAVNPAAAAGRGPVPVA
jgi:predicted RND superfamily exporter protein